MKKPEPTPQNIVCSVCGLDWKAHGKKPTLETCVTLLKAEVAKRPLAYISSTGSAQPFQFRQTG